jgi:hypothetical protein
MDDIEKNRSEYVARLETQLEHAMSELTKYKELAEKWEPRCNAEIDPHKQIVGFTLAFGGKRTTAQITVQALQQTDPTTAVSAIVDTLIESMAAERLRTTVEPELKRVMPSVKAMATAGKW